MPVEAVTPIELARVAEPEFRYGAEAFEAHQKETADEMTEGKEKSNTSMTNRKSR